MSDVITITKKQFGHYEVARDFTPSIPSERFNMNYYRFGSKETHICKSVGCLAGFLTAAFKFEDIPTYYGLGTGRTLINFEAFIKEFFGASPSSNCFLYNLFFSEENESCVETAYAKLVAFCESPETFGVEVV